MANIDPNVGLNMQINPQKNPWQSVYKVQLTGVSSWGGSGDIDVSKFSQFLLLHNVTAINGTSMALKVSTKDSYGAYTSAVVTTTVINSMGGKPFNFGEGVTNGVNNAYFVGNIVNIAGIFVAITSISCNIELWAR